MCTILKFAPSEMPEQLRRNSENASQTGEVIIFPGVRYERQHEAKKQQPKPELPVQRDFLIL